MRFISLSGLLIFVATATGLSGCATSVRQEPPAPIVDARRPPPEPARQPAPSPQTQPPPEPTRVYAYQPPGEAPTEPTTAAAADAAEGAPTTVAKAETTAPQPGAPATPNASTPSPEPAPPAAAARPSTESTVPALPAPETQAPQASSSALQPPALTPAVSTLVKQAERQRQSRDYAGAAATLERALRLQSREGYLWNRLAHVRLEQGLATQAANLAARANDLSGDSDTLKQDNWRVIADARRRAGDLQGAQDAQRRASGG
ncbi:tetratricopeptide repeat protein [Rhabdochromatium marinum]|uniref:tetratricopeptide repeat protein n=1 Tax=Rhabdochromatium marinum TaxID=48729 RepID=UPI001F5BD079|nr:hypothetical protein [Rhabdochromatium marinum]